jgi:hypothetical protein
LAYVSALSVLLVNNMAIPQSYISQHIHIIDLRQCSRVVWVYSACSSQLLAKMIWQNFSSFKITNRGAENHYALSVLVNNIAVPHSNITQHIHIIDLKQCSRVVWVYSACSSQLLAQIWQNFSRLPPSRALKSFCTVSFGQ